MSLQETIEKDFIAAYKAKEEKKVAVLRHLKTAAKNMQVELGRPLTDDEMLDVVGKQAKQRQDSADQYTSAGRDDLADGELLELSILKEYLPSQLSEAEINDVVEKTVQELGAESMKDMGKVMQSVMKEYKGRVDGKQLGEIVKARLSS